MNYELGGMRCAACASRIEKALNRISGDKAVVNFATRLARVPDEVAADIVCQAVESLGYEIRPVADFRTDPSLQPADASRDEMLLGILLGSPVFFLAMLHVNFVGNGVLQLVLTAAVLIIPGRRFFIRALRDLRNGLIGMDCLVALGAASAFCLSAVLLGLERSDFYFESASMIIVFVLVGRYLEDRARAASISSINQLRSLATKYAIVLDGLGEQKEVEVSKIDVDTRFLVRPGERVAVDAVVLQGESMFDESLVTGEAIPVGKKTGDSLLGSTVNSGFSPVIARAVSGVEATVVAQIAAIVESAIFSKAKIQKLVDQISQYFVPTVVLFSFLTLLTWKFVFDINWSEAIIHAITVLVIACPCALGLATPMAILVGTGAAARHRILIRGATGLERSGQLRTLIIDKTGTLTQGHPQVVESRYEPGVNEQMALAAAAAAEKSSLHPVAMALIAHAESRGISLKQAEKMEECPGLGVRATVDSVACLVGNLEFMRQEGIKAPGTWLNLEDEERSIIFVALDGTAAAAYLIDDELRPSAWSAISELRQQGVRVVMATGDRYPPAERVARALGIEDFYANLKPQAKLDLVKALKRPGEAVGMVGDGVNDAPAIAEADVGIAIGHGADISLDAATIVLPRGDLTSVAKAVAISRRTILIMRQNLIWAFIYNAFAISLAAFGKLTPMIASAAMALSSLSVILNSLRLREGEAHS